MNFVIPVRQGVEITTQQVEMGGRFYDLTIRYNSRDEHFMMDINRENVAVLSSVKLVNTQDLLAQYRHIEALPTGSIKIVDSSGAYSDPTKDNFGLTVQLQYQE